MRSLRATFLAACCGTVLVFAACGGEDSQGKPGPDAALGDATSAPDASAVDADVDGALDATTIDAAAIDATAIDATAIDATAIDATAIDATAIDAKAIDATAIDATAIDATAIDATAIDAAVLDALVDSSHDALPDAVATDAGLDGAHDASIDFGMEAGMGAAPRCGGTHVLADDFLGADPGEIWTLGASGGATCGESGGDAVVTLPSNGVSGSNGFFVTNRSYDLRGDTVSVEVTPAGNTATTAMAYFTVSDENGNLLQIYQQKGTLHFAAVVAGASTSLKTVAYSAAMHLYWRFREDGTNVYWETSSDGASWLVQAQAATASLFSLQFVQVTIGGSTVGGEVNPGSVHVANVNGGGTPVGKWCPMASITDDFTSSSRSAQWNRSYAQAPETVAQVGGQLVFTLASNSARDAAYVSSASYDLTGSAILIQVPATANAASTAQTYVSLTGPGSTSISMIEAKGQLVASIASAGGTQPLGTVSYSASQHAWWRIREAGGTLFWETAPDGKSWTVQSQLSPLPFAVSVLDLYVGGATPAPVASPGRSVFDNLNLPPP